MCDLGVDVIVGGHPHVIQPMELLTSTEDSNHKTICLYSTGNAISNQRRDLMTLNTGHTEDGIIFTFTFSKYSDGTVRVEEADLLPTWVDKHTDSSTGKITYDVYPLDDEVTDWKTQLQLSDNGYKNAQASYERTMKIVESGLQQVQSFLNELPPITEDNVL
jgi:poly-gamma-glutamate synthesis protein (capsule biosynthesis protein)